MTIKEQIEAIMASPMTPDDQQNLSLLVSQEVGNADDRTAKTAEITAIIAAVGK